MKIWRFRRHGGSSWLWRMSPGGMLRSVLAWRGTIETPLQGAAAEDIKIIRQIRKRTPLLMNDACAVQILNCVRSVCDRPGVMVEAGVFMGGSACLICETKGQAKLHLFDLFEGSHTPAASMHATMETEIRSHFGEHRGDLAQVRRLLSSYEGVEFHPGLFPATAAGLADERFSFVHLDLDLVASTRAALEFFHPRMVRGGILIGDDFHDPALRECFASYFAGRPDTVIVVPWGQVVVVKQAQ